MKNGSSRVRRSRLQREVRAADVLHAPTIARARELEEANKQLKAQLLATAIDLLRTRHVLGLLQRGAVARSTKSR